MVDIEKAESFQALSYCWGTECADEPIFCNGKLFTPTRNLRAALKRLRLLSEIRYMWVDAVCWLHICKSMDRLTILLYQICINQNSITERNQQVPLMREIYQKATQVIVWLGDEDDTTSLALATMQGIFESCCSHRFGHARRDQWLTNVQNDEGYWQSLKTDIVRKFSPHWPDDAKTCTNALQRFFQRPWFSRVWVIQEVRGLVRLLLHGV